jgi:Spy/CpxP family protein refolding chaperone
MLVKTKIAGLAVALMALSAPMVWADSGPTTGGAAPDTAQKDGGNWHHGHRDHMMAKILGLSQDQEKQLKDSKEKQMASMKSIFEQMKANREAFDAEMIKATPDMSKVNDLQAQLKTIQSQMVDDHLNAILEIKKILTPEQYAGYATLEKAKKLMMHKMGHGKFGRKDGWGKDGDNHKDWGDKDNDGDSGHSSDD